MLAVTLNVEGLGAERLGDEGGVDISWILV